ncbi:hypothetical protein AB0I81_40100 [Nonomuraea sp. NPDC050404]|uniref:hypothetical protein n=1 Tax=Nonomuraea sp. NPDC050404 TaxID=3155783 RepID=UPI00340C431D
MLCPTCLDGTLRVLERRLGYEERRRYSCGCPWRPLEAWILEPGGVERYRVALDRAAAEAGRIVAGFLAGA